MESLKITTKDLETDKKITLEREYLELTGKDLYTFSIDDKEVLKTTDSINRILKNDVKSLGATDEDGNHTSYHCIYYLLKDDNSISLKKTDTDRTIFKVKKDHFLQLIYA